MNEARETPSIEADWQACRRAKVRGEPTKDLKARRESMTTSRKEKEFNTRFRDGTFQELWSFVRERRLGFNVDAGEENVVQFLKKKYPQFVIGKNAQGVMGVKMYDADDTKYRFREGVEDAVETTHVEQHDDAEELAQCSGAAVSRFRKSQGSRGADLASRREDAEADDDDANDDFDGAPAMEEADSDSDAAPSCRQGPPASSPPAAHARRRPPSIASRRSSAPSESTLEMPHMTPAATRAHSPSTSAMDRSGSKRTAQQDIEGEGSGTKKRRTASEKAMEEAEATSAGLAASWSFEAHWNAKPRLRDFEAFVARVLKVARKCGGRVGEPDCLSMSQHLFREIAIIEKRNDLFQSIRHDFGTFVTTEFNADQRNLFVCTGAPRHAFIVNLWVSSLSSKIENAVREPGVAAAFFSVLRWKEVTPELPSLHTLSPDLLVEDVAKHQLTLTLALGDKVLGLSDSKKQSLLFTDCCCRRWNQFRRRPWLHKIT